MALRHFEWISLLSGMTNHQLFQAALRLQATWSVTSVDFIFNLSEILSHLPYYTNVIYKTGQCLRNHTVVNADGYKRLVKSGEAKIGLIHLSNRYNPLTTPSQN